MNRVEQLEQEIFNALIVGKTISQPYKEMVKKLIYQYHNAIVEEEIERQIGNSIRDRT